MVFCFPSLSAGFVVALPTDRYIRHRDHRKHACTRRRITGGVQMKSLRFLPVGLLVAFSSSVVLLGAAGFKAKPWTYDPNDTGFAGAAWVTHDGLSDAGGSDHALLLSNSQAGTAAAGATVDIPGPLVLSELGFDYRNDGICTAT